MGTASENPGTMLGTPTFKSGIPEEKRTRHEKILENSWKLPYNVEGKERHINPKQ